MMYLRPLDDDRPIHGGFIYSNIKSWIMRECFESGDPENFLDALVEVIDDLDSNREWLEVDEDG